MDARQSNGLKDKYLLIHVQQIHIVDTSELCEGNLDREAPPRPSFLPEANRKRHLVLSRKLKHGNGVEWTENTKMFCVKLQILTTLCGRTTLVVIM